jgi:hypothetical protein
MWGEPRRGTEAYAVKSEAEKRKKIAQEKKLDRLFIDLYYDYLQYYPHWIKNKNTKINPAISEIKEVEDKIEFIVGDKKYRIVKGNSHPHPFESSTLNDLSLYMNDKKIFEVTEEQTFNEYSDFHDTYSINAYVNDEWVEDFKQIKSYKEIASKEAEIAFAEDPKRTRELKEAFGIEKIEINNDDDKPIATNKKETSIKSKWWFWAIIIILGLILLSQ